MYSCTQSAIDIAVHHISPKCSEGQRLRGILNVCKARPVQTPNFSRAEHNTFN